MSSIPAPSPRPSIRQGLAYATPADVIADIHSLRKGYEKAGTWTLEQACWHLDATTKLRMRPVDQPAPNTPAQDGMKDVLASVLASGKLPPGLVAPDELVPPSDADASAIAAFLETMERLKTFSGPFAPHRRFGHMSDADSRKQILIHAAHHLSRLVPTTATRRHGLKFSSVAEVIADVQRLRQGHRQVGNWTLPQALWHLGTAVHPMLKPVAPDAVSSPEKQALKRKLMDPLLAGGVMPAGAKGSPENDPSGREVADEEIDRYLAGLRALDALPTQDRVDFGPFGIVTVDELRRFNLIHAANHLSNFIPTT